MQVPIIFNYFILRERMMEVLTHLTISASILAYCGKFKRWGRNYNLQPTSVCYFHFSVTKLNFLDLLLPLNSGYVAALSVPLDCYY